MSQAVLVMGLLAERPARAVDPFEIQVYDASIDPPLTAGIELHVNSVLSGLGTAPPPELPPDHQTHLTAEPSLGLTTWWEVGGYLQSAIRSDGTFDFAGFKLRSKFALPPAPASRFGWAINVEVSRLPDTYDRDRWGAEVRPIATALVAGGRLYFAVNPILDWDLAGLDADGRPDLEPAATGLVMIENLLSFGLEYYANFGPLGHWLPLSGQEHYLFEVLNLYRWRRWEINIGIGEGLTDASNRLVVKAILGFQ
ncbi:MAG TPA: hypothetical protein VHO06_13040 [Polyangia bacterium]|nr:hypothetical protein [Polyangia bacterium]